VATVKIRPLPALALAAALLVLTVPGTLAFWVGDDEVTAPELRAATLDVTLNGDLAGLGGTTGDAGFTAADLIPGESFARVITVGNAGSAPLDYSVTGHTAGALGPGLRWTVTPGGVATNSGSAATGTRAGGCTGGTTVFGPAAIPAAPTPLISTPRPLDPGADERVCVLVRLDPEASGSLQGTSADATFRVRGEQR